MTAREVDRRSRRERQILEVLYALGEGSVADVGSQLVDAPGYSAVRALLRVLEEKGHVRHRQEGRKYVYSATRSRRQAGRSALRRALRTFYDGSVARAVAAMLDATSAKLSKAESDEIMRRIREARREGR